MRERAPRQEISATRRAARNNAEHQKSPLLQACAGPQGHSGCRRRTEASLPRQQPATAAMTHTFGLATTQPHHLRPATPRPGRSPKTRTHSTRQSERARACQAKRRNYGKRCSPIACFTFQEIPRGQRCASAKAERARQEQPLCPFRARMMSRATERKPRYARKCERERKQRPRKRERLRAPTTKRRTGSRPHRRRRNAHHAPKRRLHAPAIVVRGNVRSRLERGKSATAALTARFSAFVPRCHAINHAQKGPHKSRRAPRQESRTPPAPFRRNTGFYRRRTPRPPIPQTHARSPRRPYAAA